MPKKITGVLSGGDSLKTCRRCLEHKERSEFSSLKKSRDGLYCYCRSCSRAINTVSYATYAHRSSRNAHLRGAYGVSLSDYELLLQRQNGVCAICGIEETKRHSSGKLKSLAVDHDHETGEVRGLLCGNCNAALGMMLDDEERLLKAVEYLRAAKRGKTQ